MGQYGNQPDFATRAKNIVPIGDGYADTGGERLGSAALYIGTGGTLVCNVVGGNNFALSPTVTIFKNIPNGTFFPVIVENVWYQEGDTEILTTCSDIVALY